MENADKFFDMFKKEEDKKLITIGELAESLNMSVEELQELTLNEITELTVEKAETDSKRVNELLAKRNQIFEQQEKQFGLTPEEQLRIMESETRMYFDELTMKGERNGVS